MDATQQKRVLPEGYFTARALGDVHAERVRQVSVEGWSAEHDDKHDRAELARAAASYLMNYIAGQTWFALSSQVRATVAWLWPWSHDWWKPAEPATPRRDLIKAGALVLAQIERDDRAAADQTGEVI